MNTKRETLVRWIYLLGLVFLPACLDMETTTKVNSNGSILRTIIFEDDSASIFRGEFPVALDSTWHRTTQEIGKDKFRLIASKLYDNVDEMNQNLKGTFGKSFEFQFQLESNFQWFFTNYRFAETNLKYIQYDSIPLTEFVSQDEIDAWERHEVEKIPYETKGDSLAVMSAEPRFVEWENRNVFEPVFAAFIDGVRELHDPRLDPSPIMLQKNTLYKSSKEGLRLGGIDTLELIFSKVLKNPLVHKAWQLKADAFRKIKEKRDMNFVSGTLSSNVIMPGLITGSNARTIEGNKATWRDYGDYARIFGYTMWVESRQVNWWAVILTAIVVMTLAVLLTASALRRRRLA